LGGAAILRREAKTSRERDVRTGKTGSGRQKQPLSAASGREMIALMLSS
jgi:hypothetical protein